VKPKEMMEKGQKGWEQVKPVAGPLLGTLAKAYLEKGKWGIFVRMAKRGRPFAIALQW
jgi:hypothetical protein